jgi:hypothetical protein
MERIMELQQKLITQQHMLQYHNTEFVWGESDCNIFFIDWHDKVYGTTDLKKVKHQYISQRDAVRFYRKMGITANQWMHFKGYNKTDTKVWRDGDILYVPHKLYPTAWIVFNNRCWSMLEDSVGVHIATFEVVAHKKPTVFRKGSLLDG